MADWLAIPAVVVLGFVFLILRYRQITGCWPTAHVREDDPNG